MNLEPERDRELARALRRLEGGADLDEAAWSRMAAGIRARAARRFRPGDEPAAWWELIAGWARTAVPAAAGVALLCVVLTLPELGQDLETTVVDPAVLERGGLALLVSGDVPEQEAIGAIVGPGDRDWLVESVMGGSEE